MIARPHSILLDSDALSSLVAGERRMQAWASVARHTDSVLYASTAVLAEVADGSARDANLRRIIKAIRFIEVSLEIGLAAGRLRATAATNRRKPRDLTVDSLVAATALGLPGPVVVLTSDPADFGLLLVDTGIKVEAIS